MVRTMNPQNPNSPPASSGGISRRSALPLTALAASSYKRILGANDRVQVGFIGFGLIGHEHVFDFSHQKDCDLAAMCDVYQPRLEEGLKACGPQAKGYKDFRQMLDNKDLQAVVIGTPDHWHAPLTILSCAAGKDVYVEKPLTLFVREGRWMVQAARKYNRVVQAGTQQRSGKHYQKAKELLEAGYLGKIMYAHSGSQRNVMPGFGTPLDSDPPPDLDYNMWLGPAPLRAYNKLRSLYHFRWFWDYSGGQMTNLGAHELDIIHWVMQVKGPISVSSVGGRFALQDICETPDTQDAIFEYPGFTVHYAYREASAGRRVGYGLEFNGERGGLVINRGGFEIFPDMKIDPMNAIPVFQGHPTGGPERSKTTPVPWTQPMKVPGSSAEQFDLHARNFLDCVKSRQRPIADVEGAHQVAVACHLANMSLKLGRRLRWDADNEVVVGDAEANALLERPYREPWGQAVRHALA